jgi:hypothetical protein
MASTVLTAVEAIAPLESVHIATTAESFVANRGVAERKIPLQRMEALPKLRHRAIQSGPPTTAGKNEESSPESVEALTPTSTEEQEIEGNTLSNKATQPCNIQ